MAAGRLLWDNKKRKASEGSNAGNSIADRGRASFGRTDGNAQRRRAGFKRGWIFPSIY
jgi:hypothetical protein